MTDTNRPSDEELSFLQEMGMEEVEPGRWVSGWQGSDPGMQALAGNLGSESEEHLDLLMRAGRVQNEFDLEQSGATTAVNVQRTGPGPLGNHPPGEFNLAAYVAVRDDSIEAFEALDGSAIEDAFDAMWDKYEAMPHWDALAAALRSLGIKCKTITLDPMTAGPSLPDAGDYPGFRPALVHITDGVRSWVHPG